MPNQNELLETINNLKLAGYEVTPILLSKKDYKKILIDELKVVCNNESLSIDGMYAFIKEAIDDYNKSINAINSLN